MNEMSVYETTMPTIAVLAGGITIAIYYNDHNPPHFHATQAEYEILVEIARLRVIAGNAPTPMINAVFNWGARHQRELALCWIRAQSAQPPGRIGP